MKTKKRILYSLPTCLIALAFFTNISVCFSKTINVNDFGNGTASLENTQSAYNQASYGDIIIFPQNGTATWSSALTVSKAITIFGNGTTLIAGGDMPNGFFHINNLNTTELVRISSFVFQMIDTTTRFGILINKVNLTSLRIDHNTFHHGNYQLEVGGSKGSIDNNYFYNGIKDLSFTAGSNEQATASWQSLAAGTGDALFVEDNHFIVNSEYQKGFTQENIGTYNGGKLVVRYNEFDSDHNPLIVTVTPIETHGNAAGGASNGYWQAGAGAKRGQSVVEIYENNMHGRRIDWLAVIRGSANLIYNNTVVSQSTNTTRIRLREEEYYEASNWNPLRTAWPAEDQIHNSFIWGNTFDGKSQTSANFYIEKFIEENRDYFLHEPKSSGGKEIFTGANGASDSFPTDGNTYPTLGTMEFVATGANEYYPYTAYTYPHPLQKSLSPRELRFQ